MHSLTGTLYDRYMYMTVKQVDALLRHVMTVEVNNTLYFVTPCVIKWSSVGWSLRIKFLRLV